MCATKKTRVWRFCENQNPQVRYKFVSNRRSKENRVLICAQQKQKSPSMSADISDWHSCEKHLHLLETFSHKGFMYLLRTLHLKTCFSSAAATFAMITALVARMNAQRVSRALIMPNLPVSTKRTESNISLLHGILPLRTNYSLVPTCTHIPHPRELKPSSTRTAHTERLLIPRSSALRNARTGACEIRQIWLTLAVIEW